MLRKKLGEILLEKKLITVEQLEECLSEQKLTKEYLGAILLKKGLINESGLMSALSEQFQIPFVNLKTSYIDWKVALEFASIVTKEQKALPILREENTVTVAISNPLDVMAVSSIEEEARPKKIKLILVTQAQLSEFILECKKKAKGSIRNLLNK